MVRNPVTSHAPINSTGESTRRAISADTIKMPEPIMEPMTSVVALVRPKPLTNSLSPEVRDTVFSSVANEPRVIHAQVERRFSAASASLLRFLSRLHSLLKKSA